MALETIQLEPQTVEEAVGKLVSGLTPEDINHIKDPTSSPVDIHHFGGMQMRNQWKLWYPDTPLKRDAVMKYGIAHADDISGLIFEWVWHKVRDVVFDPVAYCHTTFDTHWRAAGTTSLEAGGWKPDGSGPLEKTVKDWEEVTRGKAGA